MLMIGYGIHTGESWVKCDARLRHELRCMSVVSTHGAARTNASTRAINEYHFLVDDLKGNHATFKRVHHDCRNSLIKKGKA